MPTTTTVNLDDGEIAAHFDLAANDVATIRFVSTGDGAPAATLRPVSIRNVEVTLVNGTEPLFFTTDDSEPALRSKRCYIVPVALSSEEIPPVSYRPVVVKVICGASATVTVKAVR